MAHKFGTQAAIGVLAAMCGLGVLAGAAYYVTHRAEVGADDVGGGRFGSGFQWGSPAGGILASWGTRVAETKC
jgi:hypothetical protein